MKTSLQLLKAILLLTIMFFCIDVFSQCPMCRAAAEQNLAGGGEASRGLNKGIFYLFLTPYSIVLVIGSIWYWNYRKMQKAKLV